MGISVLESRAQILAKVTALSLTIIVFLAFLVGCAQPGTPGTPESGESQAEPLPSQNEEGEAQNEPIACQEQAQKAIEETVNSQTKAFSDSEYELAYSFASPAFRSSVTLEGFVAIIAGSYGPLIDSSELRFSDCLINSATGRALIDVSFLQSGDFVYALRYLMIDTPDGWRVEGASNLEVVGEGT